MLLAALGIDVNGHVLPGREEKIDTQNSILPNKPCPTQMAEAGYNEKEEVFSGVTLKGRVSHWKPNELD